MKLTSPFTALRGALSKTIEDIPTCFIDETEVALKECGVSIEEKAEDSRLVFWDEECQKHPTNSHCRVFDD